MNQIFLSQLTKEAANLLCLAMSIVTLFFIANLKSFWIGLNSIMSIIPRQRVHIMQVFLFLMSNEKLK